MDKVIVLGHKNPYNFEQDGKHFEGVKLSFINAYASTVPGEKGFVPMSITMNTDVLKNLQELPGVYEISYGLKSGKNGKPETIINDLKFVKSVDISKLVV